MTPCPFGPLWPVAVWEAAQLPCFCQLLHSEGQSCYPEENSVLFTFYSLLQNSESTCFRVCVWCNKIYPKTHHILCIWVQPFSKSPHGLHIIFLCCFYKLLLCFKHWFAYEKSVTLQYLIHMSTCTIGSRNHQIMFEVHSAIWVRGILSVEVFSLEQIQCVFKSHMNIQSECLSEQLIINSSFNSINLSSFLNSRNFCPIMFYHFYAL